MRNYYRVTKKLHLALPYICTFLPRLSLANDTPQLDIGAPLDLLKPSELHDSFNDLHHGDRHEAIDIMRPRGTRFTPSRMAPFATFSLAVRVA